MYSMDMKHMKYTVTPHKSIYGWYNVHVGGQTLTGTKFPNSYDWVTPSLFDVVLIASEAFKVKHLFPDWVLAHYQEPEEA